MERVVKCDIALKAFMIFMLIVIAFELSEKATTFLQNLSTQIYSYFSKTEVPVVVQTPAQNN